VLAVLLLGVNLWLIALLWPSAPASDGHGPWATLAGLAPLLLGVIAHNAIARSFAPPPWVAGTLLLAGFPAALGAVLATRQEHLNQLALGPLALALLAAALCAYGASAALACAETAPELAAERSALGREPWNAPEPERGRLQRAIVGVTVLGAAAIVVVAPSLGGFAELEAAWGDAALAGGVLTAVIGAALGVATVSVFLGSGLRSEAEGEAAAADTSLRAAWFLFLSLLGAVTYFVVTS
jgi:hypothetical protein